MKTTKTKEAKEIRILWAHKHKLYKELLKEKNKEKADKIRLEITEINIRLEKYEHD